MGKQGFRHTDKTKRKLSEMRKGERNPFFGRTHSAEFKRELSRRSKRRKYDGTFNHVAHGNGRQPCYFWQVCAARDVHYLLKEMQQWLVIKRQQAKEALAHLQSKYGEL
jgi:hypothetical protein